MTSKWAKILAWTLAYETTKGARVLTPSNRLELLQDASLIVPSYLDAGHMTHAGQSLTAALDPDMGIDPSLDPTMDPSMDPSLDHGLQPEEAEERYGNAMEDEHSDDAVEVDVDDDDDDDVAREPLEGQGAQTRAGQDASLSR